MKTGARTAVAIATFTAACALLSLVTSPANAQTPPGTEGQFSYHPTEGARGDSIFFDAKCLWGGSGRGVQLLVSATSPTQAGVEFGHDYEVATDGTISGQLVVPEAAPSGDYWVTGTCHAGDQVFFWSGVGPFTVTSPPLDSSTTTTAALASTATSSDFQGPDKLPRTGGDIALLAAVSVLLIVLGVTINRRSRRLS